MMTFARYDPSLEQQLDDEEALMGKLETMMVDLTRLVKDKHNHAFHGTHAKLTGLLTGTLEVLPGLPAELAQGMFAHPRRYDAVVRLAPGAPEPLTDKASGQRGLSIKVMGVEGERLQGFGESASQDWVLGLDPAFTAATARDFLHTFRYTGVKSPHLPEPAILALSRAARGVEAALEAIGTEAPNLKFFGRPPAHPFAESFYTQAAVRYGDYVAKLAAMPSADTLAAVINGAPLGSTRDAFREAACKFVADQPVVYDIRVQLCADIQSMPIEDASAVWSEADSPYRTVARLTLPPQEAWTPERAAYDDRLAYSPAHALVAHQPLGSIMRARMRAYRATAQFRISANGIAAVEPLCATDIP
ncbi:MAG: catalase family protein [Rhizorhabdus sp.]